MTENELRKLTPEERRAFPEPVLMGAVLTTLDEAHDLLAMEGWGFVSFDERFRDDADDAPEVWRRQVGGRVEWCELASIGPQPDLPPEQCWHRAMWPTDPRLIED